MINPLVTQEHKNTHFSLPRPFPLLTLFSSTQDSFRLPIVGPAVMQQELDGVRLLSNTCCEFMHRVSCKLVNL